MEGIKQPILFNATENDSQIPAEKLEKFKEILAKKPDVPSDVKVTLQTLIWGCSTQKELL